MEKPKVAIACQGGGSHAAFAAGVLCELFSERHRDQFELVALSGTSGGAVCSALAWAGMIRGKEDEAIRHLSGFWHDLEVHSFLDAVMNFWAVIGARSPITMEISPYSHSSIVEQSLRTLLEKHLKLDSLPRDPGSRSHPNLFVGATEILSGKRKVFHDAELTYESLIASAAIPPLYRAVRIGEHLYWDGLFTCNPPIREFTEASSKPTEIWIIRINPETRAAEPRTVREITDRRNELSGNLSLDQELYFIQKINELLKDHSSLGSVYHEIKIRVVELGVENLDYASKLDRSPFLIEKLLANGADCAAKFFSEESVWPPEKADHPADIRKAAE